MVGNLARELDNTYVVEQIGVFGRQAPALELRLGLMVACLGSILLSASRSALVATLMGVGYVFFMYFRHAPKKLFRALLALFFLGILLVPFVQHFGANTLAKQQANLSMGSAMSSRTQLWEDRATGHGEPKKTRLPEKSS